MGKQSSSINHLQSLDGLRAIAIIAVILSHSEAIISLHPRWLQIGKSLREGVDLFFAISGLLITSLLIRERENTNHLDILAFYTRRAFRILPPILFYFLVLGILKELSLLDIKGWEFVSSLLFFRNYSPMAHGDGQATGHFWSLSVEEHFYLLWPLCIAMCTRRRALSLAIAIALLVAAWRGLDARYHLFARYFPDTGVLFRTDTRLDALLYGCIGGLLLPKARQLKGIRYGQCVPWFTIVFIVVAHLCRLPTLPTILAVSYSVVVLSCVIWGHGITLRWLDSPFLRVVGVTSYSLYIWQTLWVGSPQISFSVRHIGDRGIVWWWIVDLTFLTLCAGISFLFVEQPLRKIGYRVSKRIGASSSQQAAMRV